MPQFQIHELVPQKNIEDFRMLLPAYLSIWNSSGNLEYLSVTLNKFREDAVSYWLLHHLDMGGRYLALSDTDGQIRGIAVIKESHVEGFEIFGFAISPDTKNMGAGRLLLQHCIDMASAGGFHALRCGVFTNNKPMLALLIKNDFIPAGIIHRACDDGRDIIYLKRYL